MHLPTPPVPASSRPSPIIVVALYFFFVTVILRTLAESDLIASRLPLYLGLEFLIGALFTLVLRRPPRIEIWQYLYFVFQSLLALILLVPHPQLDFFNLLLVLLSFQVALVFRGWVRWAWIVALILLIILSLTFLLGVYGLSLSLLPGAAALVFPAYVIVTQEIESGQQKRQALLAELQDANRRLTSYAGQVEELSSIHERNRLARELHDSVSQTMFSIGLYSRSARILLERDPDRLRPQLEQLQALTQSALTEMRSLIADLRPRESETDKRLTS